MGVGLWRSRIYYGFGEHLAPSRTRFLAGASTWDRETAKKIVYNQDRPYLNFIKNRSKRYNYFAAVKALLDMEGLPGGPVRPPLLNWPKEDLPALRAEMVRIGLLRD